MAVSDCLIENQGLAYEMADRTIIKHDPNCWHWNNNVKPVRHLGWNYQDSEESWERPWLLCNHRPAGSSEHLTTPQPRKCEIQLCVCVFIKHAGTLVIIMIGACFVFV